MQVLHNHVPALGDHGEAEGIGAGVRVSAGRRIFSRGSPVIPVTAFMNPQRPLGIETYGVDIDDSDRLPRILQDESGGE